MLQIDLQWLVIHCDPYLANRETCDEIPPPPKDMPDDECPAQCPAGEAGPPGLPVSI